MAIKVIGAGVGRTGTESLKKALEQLGFGKCYHMFELMKDGSRLTHWLDLMDGKKPDYEALFRDYQSCVDFPAAIYYREFMQQYPDAKVILTVRDADKWFDSASKTIFKPIPPVVMLPIRFAGLFSSKARSFPKGYEYAKEIVHRRFFKNRITDREFCKKIFNEWNEEVKRTVSPDKLLVFEVKHGWAPLCKFLNVPVPDSPFPKSNDSNNFQKNVRKQVLDNSTSSPL